MTNYADKTDTRRPILTPEGGTLTVRVAGPVPRAIAWIIDTVIRVIGYFGLAIVVAIVAPGGFGQALFALTIFASEWLYFSLFEGFKGATPGKKRCGLIVVQRDGSPCGLEASFVRNIVRFVDFLPPFYGFGLMSLFFSPDFQRLGDRAAGTLVVYGDKKVPKKPVASRRPQSASARRRSRRRAEPEDGPQASFQPVAVPVALTGEEEAAILEFARRAPVWGQDRAAEIANLAEPLTGLRGSAGRQRLMEYALWLEERGA